MALQEGLESLDELPSVALGLQQMPSKSLDECLPASSRAGRVFKPHEVYLVGMARISWMCGLRVVTQ